MDAYQHVRAVSKVQNYVILDMTIEEAQQLFSFAHAHASYDAFAQSVLAVLIAAGIEQGL